MPTTVVIVSMWPLRYTATTSLSLKMWTWSISLLLDDQNFTLQWKWLDFWKKAGISFIPKLYIIHKKTWFNNHGSVSKGLWEGVKQIKRNREPYLYSYKWFWFHCIIPLKDKGWKHKLDRTISHSPQSQGQSGTGRFARFLCLQCSPADSPRTRQWSVHGAAFAQSAYQSLSG